MAGIISQEETLRLVARRARLLAALPPGGGMLALAADEATTVGLIEQTGLADELELAALNGPAQSVVSGPEGALAQLEQGAAAAQIAAQRLAVNTAFHSRAVEPALEALTGAAARIDYQPARCRWIRGLAADVLAEGDTLTADYWAAQTRGAVRFAQALQTLLALPDVPLLLEFGPAATLTALARPLAGDQHTLLASMRLVRLLVV
jgi:acyl transferase domain-containing protein